jgi:hypothetical protein
MTPFLTKSGLRRGATVYQFCKAVHAVMLSFPKEWVDAAYIRTGWATRDDLAAISKKSPMILEDAIASLNSKYCMAQ